MSSKTRLNEQAQKLQNLVGSARLKTTQQDVTAENSVPVVPGSKQEETVAKRSETVKTKAKNLRAIPVSYFEAHAALRAASKTSLDFSSYILEALREKLDRDGALDIK